MHGERGSTPRGALPTFLLLVTGVLPAWRLSVLFATTVLGLRRPMTLQFSGAGVSVCERVEWSGRVLEDTRRWIPRENLARVSREASSSRLGLYAGTVALLLGTYLGTRRVIDGLGVFGGSPALWSSGLLVLVVGAAVDFALWNARDIARTRCQVVVVPRRGRAFSCRGLDRRRADEALRAVESPLYEPGSPRPKKLDESALTAQIGEGDSATVRPTTSR